MQVRLKSVRDTDNEEKYTYLAKDFIFELEEQNEIVEFNVHVEYILNCEGGLVGQNVRASFEDDFKAEEQAHDLRPQRRQMQAIVLKELTKEFGEKPKISWMDERQTRYAVRTLNDEKTPLVKSKILELDPQATFLPEGNPVTFWVDTTLSEKELEEIEVLVQHRLSVLPLSQKGVLAAVRSFEQPTRK